MNNYLVKSSLKTSTSGVTAVHALVMTVFGHLTKAGHRTAWRDAGWALGDVVLGFCTPDMKMCTHAIPSDRFSAAAANITSWSCSEFSSAAADILGHP
jgi:hypothetical protein